MESFNIVNSNFISSSLYRGYAAKTPIKSITIVKNNLINRHVLKRVTPTAVTAKDQGEYKFNIDVMLTYDK